jgi:hypothetical protein
MGPSYRNRHTNPRAGQSVFNGITKEGFLRMKQLKADSAAARSAEANLEKEKAFLKKLREEMGAKAATAEEQNAGKGQPLAVIGDDEEEKEADEMTWDDVEDAFDGDFWALIGPCDEHMGFRARFFRPRFSAFALCCSLFERLFLFHILWYCSSNAILMPCYPQTFFFCPPRFILHNVLVSFPTLVMTI